MTSFHLLKRRLPFPRWVQNKFQKYGSHETYLQSIHFERELRSEYDWSTWKCWRSN